MVCRCRAVDRCHNVAELEDYAAAYVIPWIGEERVQRLTEPQLLKRYRRLLADGRVNPDNNSEMYAYWSDRVAKGENPTPREVSEACKTTIHAARAAVRRYKSGIVPTKTTRGLAPKTVRNVHALIHRALVDAVAWKYIGNNPASSIKPPRRPRTHRDVWAPDQIQIFLKSVQEDRFAALFLLELTTGIRRGQLCGLKWLAVDLQAGDITVHDNRVVVGGQARDKAGGKTKNADQTISIDRVTTAALQRWREIQNREREFFGSYYNPGNYVFTFEDGRPPHPDTIRQRFDRLAAAAGLPRHNHDLRHRPHSNSGSPRVSPATACSTWRRRSTSRRRYLIPNHNSLIRNSGSRRWTV
jgi:integrase